MQGEYCEGFTQTGLLSFLFVFFVMLGGGFIIEDMFL